LARYVPGENLALLIEFPGLDADTNAWNATSAAKILTETQTGPMLEEILTQLHAQLVAVAGPSSVTSAEEVAMLRHLIRRGLILGVTAGRQQPSAGGTVLVLRDAFTAGIKEPFARQLLNQMQPEVKPELFDKPGNRRVAVTRLKSNGQPVAWWVEDRRDIVIVTPPEHVDRILSTLQSKSPNATSVPRRQALAAPSGAFRPLAWGYLDFQEAPPLPEEAAQLGLDAVSALEFRWGAENRALRTEVHLQVPPPRQGLLALFEQPTFSISSIPPIPDQVDSLSILSLDLAKTLERLTELIAQSGIPNASDELRALETEFKRSTRLDLRQDLLAHLGPKILSYTVPQKRNGLAALNSFNPLAGFQLPRMAIRIDAPNPKALHASITQLISFANKQLAQLETPAPAAGSTPPPAGAGATAAAKANRFEFKMTSTKPLTYQLQLPAQFAALFQAKPTLTLGSRHLVIATAPDLAADAVKGDEQPDLAWTPPAEFSDALSGLSDDLIYLQLTDTRQTLPKAIDELPSAINKAAASISAGRMPPPSDVPGQPPVPPPPTLQIVIPPDKLPKSSEIEPYLFPGAIALSVQKSGISLVLRDSFFDITTITAVLNGLAQAPVGSVGPLPLNQPERATLGGQAPTPGAEEVPPGNLPEPPSGGRRGGLRPEPMTPPTGRPVPATPGSRRGGLTPEAAPPTGRPSGTPSGPAGGRRSGLRPEIAPPASGGAAATAPD
jgi:hypothetical protein